MISLSTFFSRAKRATLCMVALFMLTTTMTPAPAQASFCCYVFQPAEWVTDIGIWIASMAKWAKSHLLKEDTIDAFTSFYDTASGLFAQLRDKINYLAGADMGAPRTLSAKMQALGKAEADHIVLEPLKEMMMKNAAAHVQPTNQNACKAITAHQAPVLAAPLAAGMAHTVLQGVAIKSRTTKQGAGGVAVPKDGSGPAYAAEEWSVRGKWKFMNTRDGAPSNYVRSGTMGPEGPPYADGDLFQPTGLYPMTMPAVTSETVGGITANVIEPNPNDGEQMAAAAAINYLHKIAGPFPTPLRGKALKQPVGKVQRSMFNHCIATQNGLMTPCAELVTFYTKPNCEKSPADCERQKIECQAGTGGLMNSASFAMCEKGMSLYQTLLMEHAGCVSFAHYQMQGQAGATPASMADTNNMCALAWTAFQGYLLQKHENCNKAIAAITQMGSCKGAVEKLGRGGARAQRDADPANDNLAVTNPLYHQAGLSRWQGAP